MYSVRHLTKHATKTRTTVISADLIILLSQDVDSLNPNFKNIYQTSNEKLGWEKSCLLRQIWIKMRITLYKLFIVFDPNVYISSRYGTTGIKLLDKISC